MNKFSACWLGALAMATLLASCEGENGVNGTGLIGILLMIAVVVIVIVWVVRKRQR